MRLISMQRLRRAVRAAAAAALVAAGSTALAAAVVSAIVMVLGRDPGDALGAIHAGSVGSGSGVSETLKKAAPLVFTGLSVALAFRCGIWNIGAEGQFLAGMLGATITALALPPLPPALAVALALVAGALSGAAWAAGPALLKLRRGVPEVISTIMLNFLAVYLIQYLVRGPLRDPTSASDWSPLIPEPARLPQLRSLFGIGIVGGDPVRMADGRPLLALGFDAGILHVGVVLALAAAPVVWFWLARSRFGFRLRAVGLNDAASRSSGIPVARTVLVAFLTSGALAGLGGGVEVLGVIQRMYRYEPGSPGYGFSGIAVALLAGLHPMGVMAAALFFGALSAGCNQMQRSAGISFQVAYVIQAAVILVLVGAPRLRLGLTGQTGGTGERKAVSG